MIRCLLHLLKVTAYFLECFLMGPGILDKIPKDNVKLFAPLLKLATALAAFNIGCEVACTKVRRIAKRKMS